MYYTVIKHSRHLRTLEKCRKHEPVACVFYIFLVCSNVRWITRVQVQHPNHSAMLPPPSSWVCSRSNCMLFSIISRIPFSGSTAKIPLTLSPRKYPDKTPATSLLTADPFSPFGPLKAYKTNKLLITTSSELCFNKTSEYY